MNEKGKDGEKHRLRKSEKGKQSRNWRNQSQPERVNREDIGGYVLLAERII